MNRIFFLSVVCVFPFCNAVAYAGILNETIFEVDSTIDSNARKTDADPVTNQAAPSPVKSTSDTHYSTRHRQYGPVDGKQLAGAPAASVGALSRIENAASAPRLKCWQHGRLIIDKSVRVFPPEVRGVGSGIFQDRETGAIIHAFDLKNATCIAQ